jgi:hypothetical protein
MRMLLALIPGGAARRLQGWAQSRRAGLSLELSTGDLPAITASILPSHWSRLFDGANLDRLAR